MGQSLSMLSARRFFACPMVQSNCSPYASAVCFCTMGQRLPYSSQKPQFQCSLLCTMGQRPFLSKSHFCRHPNFSAVCSRPMGQRLFRSKSYFCRHPSLVFAPWCKDITSLKFNLSGVYLHYGAKVYRPKLPFLYKHQSLGQSRFALLEGKSYHKIELYLYRNIIFRPLKKITSLFYH